MSDSQWPTAVAADGTAPSLMELVGSEDAELRRQGSYLLQAAAYLKDLEQEPEALQQPGHGITVPLFVKNAKGARAVVYTFSEEWTAARIRSFQEWVRVLRTMVPESIPVVVVSQYASPEVAGLPEVFHFMNLALLTDGTTPAPAESEAPAEEGSPEDARQMAERYIGIVKKNFQYVPDYTPHSLSFVDGSIDKIKESGTSEEAASGMLYAVGCYLGEVFVRHAHGEWASTASMDMTSICNWPLVIRMPDGSGLNPIGKVFKRFRNGKVDDIESFYTLMTSQGLDRLKGQAE